MRQEWDVSFLSESKIDLELVLSHVIAVSGHVTHRLLIHFERAVVSDLRSPLPDALI